MLKRTRIPHAVLNAKYHQKEAEIVSKAGLPGAVTIATNMAGRGTDIKLGTGVSERGGLHIIGTERHEARRIDRQLRGRAGRQGDPGSSQFYLSLEDDLMRLFQSDRVATVMDKLGVEEGEVIEHRFMTKAIERAQKRVEEQNFGIRKHLLEYDNVMNKQREIIYKRRLDALENDSLAEECRSLVADIAAATVEELTTASGSPYADDWDFEALRMEMRRRLGVDVDFEKNAHDGKKPEDLKELGAESTLARYDERERFVGPEVYRQFERFVCLTTIDTNWKDHLYGLDRLREGIGLRAYGQKDPLLEYKKEAFELFADLTDRIDLQTAERLMKTEIRAQAPRPVAPVGVESRPVMAGAVASPGGAVASPNRPAPGARRAVRPTGPLLPPAPSGSQSDGKAVGRNDPCPCGSGKKYKKCHGRNA
jgi:preprotein translocase subunit SecA